MSALSTSDFDEYFTELWGYSSYAWQRELVNFVAGQGRWPGRIDLPTGTGKSSVLDIAAFCMALDAQRNSLRRHPRRVVVVVDRRIVVDQAGFRGTQLLSKLETALPGTVLGGVANLLRGLSSGAPDGRSLVGNSTVLRGGIVRDESWAERPDVPAFLVGTVDQIGSRLLFQGYGLGRGARPIHAGLLGCDTLVLLDEVHLAVPFAETLQAFPTHRSGNPDVPWGVCELSATPRADGPTEVFPHPDLRNELLSESSIVQRVRASKPALLVDGGKVPSDNQKANIFTAKKLAEETVSLLGESGSPSAVVGVIANRVDTAREVAAILSSVKHAPEVLLITGRMRAFDRDTSLVTMRQQLETRSARSDRTRALVVVGTQSLEAGADFDA